MNHRPDLCTARLGVARLLGFRGGARSMTAPSPRISSSGPPSGRRRGVVSRGHGASLSGRNRRGVGGDLAVDFWSPSSSASRRRLLQRRRGDGGGCTGAAAVGLVWLAVGRRATWSVLCSWSAAGGSGVVPRCARREVPDLEVVHKLGAVPRPACHRDKCCISDASFRWFRKPFIGDGAASTSDGLASVTSSSGVRRAGARGGRRIRADVAGDPKGPFVIFFLLWGSFCILYESTCPSGPFRPVCTYFVLVLSLT